MLTNFRKLQPSDLDDDRKLELYIRGLEASVESLLRQADQQATSRMQLSAADLFAIKGALESGGAAELDLTNLTGITAEPGDARIPRVTAHPDPTQTPYDTYVLTGTPDTLWQIDRTQNPPVKVQIATVATHNLLSSVHTDTVAATVVAGDLIAGNSTPAWARFALGGALAGLRVNAGATNIEWSTKTAMLDRANTFEQAQQFDLGVRISNTGATVGWWGSFTPTLTPALVAANTTAEQTFAGVVTGAATTDIPIVVKPTHQAGLGIVGARIPGADNLAITFVNATAAGITPTAAETYRVFVIRP